MNGHGAVALAGTFEILNRVAGELNEGQTLHGTLPLRFLIQ